MKFYEFKTDKFDYYALIGAGTEDDAIKEYVEVVCDIEDKNPVEISKEVVLTKCQDDFGLKTAEYMFNELIEMYKTHIFLIDRSLM